MDKRIRATLLCCLLGLPIAAHAGGRGMEAESGALALLEAARQDYSKALSKRFDAAIVANSSASSAGKLCRGELDAAATARALSKSELELCAQAALQWIELPLAFDAIAVVVNPRNTWAKQVALQELKRAWIDAPGKAKSWKDMSAAFPDRPLKLYGPAQKVGLATNYRAALSPAGAEGLARLRGDINGTEVLSAVAEGVARDELALGILDWTTYKANERRVRMLPVVGAQEEGVGALRYLLRLYVSTKALRDPEMRGFLAHLLGNGERLSKQLGLIPLAAAEYEKARNLVAGK